MLLRRLTAACDAPCPAAGKLFPGPHLYAGAGIVVMW